MGLHLQVCHFSRQDLLPLIRRGALRESKAGARSTVSSWCARQGNAAAQARQAKAQYQRVMLQASLASAHQALHLSYI